MFPSAVRVLPHVLVADDLDNGAGHLGAAQADPLQQRLQPPHIALHVRVQERQDIACGQKPWAPSGSHIPGTPRADGAIALHPALPKISPGSRATAGGAGDPDGCLLTPPGARRPGLAHQDALLPATCEPPAPQLCSPEPLGQGCSTVSAQHGVCRALLLSTGFSCPPRELSEGSQGELCRRVAGLLLTFGNLRSRQPGPYQTVPLFEMQDLHFWEP